MNKFTENELIEKLAQLRQTEPDKNWVIFCREKLSSAIAEKIVEKPIVIEPVNSQFGFIFWLKNFAFNRQILRPISVFSLVFVLIFGSGLTALSSAKQSLPGDHLYAVKIALEQARLFATTSAEGKAEFQSDMIAARLDELNKVINTGGSIETNKPRIEAAVNNLQKHLAIVKQDLSKLDDTEANKASNAARKIDENATQAETALNQAKLALPANMAVKISEAADEAGKTSAKALEMLVSRQGEEGGPTQAEILAKVDERIQKTEAKIKDLEISVANLEIGNKLPINATIIFDETDKAVIQAKESLENNDIAGALQTIQAANEILKGAEKLVEGGTSSEQPSDVPAIPSKDTDNASTSSNAIPSATSTSSFLEVAPSISSPTIPPAPSQATISQ